MGLSHIQASLSRLQKEGEAKGKKGHDYKRYAKIGVVSVGAGALLAFTGGGFVIFLAGTNWSEWFNFFVLSFYILLSGLAAPAVAAALVVFGTSTGEANILTRILLNSCYRCVQV